jgi:acyl-CoA synthetase (NDP forming)
MAAPGTEVIVGVTRDLQFGHAVMFGLGGVFVEAMRDVSFRVVPLSSRDAAEMIAEIRGRRVLSGLRGNPPADLPALRALLLRVSAYLSEHPEVEEMDLNPVIVHERGLTVADARVVRGA